MLNEVKSIWKIGAAIGAVLVAGSVGGAAYDMHQAKKNIALLDDDDFDDETEDGSGYKEVEG